MKLRNQLVDTFNIYPGEGWPIALMAAYSFFIGIFLAYFISLANAFFLAEFGVSYLPHGYIASGIVGYAVGIALTRMQRRLSFPQLLQVILLLPLVMTFALRTGFWLTSSKWLAFSLFIVIGSNITLVYFVFRSLSGRLFNMRQGKRLLGLISTGDVISSIIGFFSVPVLAVLFDDDTNLLLIATGALMLAFVVLRIMLKRFAGELSAEQQEARDQADAGFAELLKNRYFVYLFAVAAAAVLGFYYIDYTFLTQLRQRFQDRNSLAEFIGIFYGIIRIIELLFKTIMSGWLLSNYGLRFSLASLPFLLLICIVVAVGTAVADGVAFLFLLLAFGKLIERVLAKSLYDPSVNLLYQPLSAAMRLPVQTKVEGFVQPLAVGLAGGTLLIFGWIGSFQLVLFALVLLLAGWGAASLLMYREYRRTLLRNLEEGAGGGNQSLSRDTSSIALLLDHLESGREDNALRAFYLLQNIAPLAIDRSLAALCSHPVAEIRCHAARWMGDERNMVVRQEVSRLAQADTDPQVRAWAARAVAELDKALASSSAMFEARAASARPSDRADAARLCAQRGDVQDASLQLARFADDERPEVRGAALTAAGRRGSPDLWPLVLKYLDDPACSSLAVDAATAAGADLIPAIKSCIANSAHGPVPLARAVRACGMIGGNEAEELLLGWFNYPDRQVQTEVLAALKMCGYRGRGEHYAALRQKIEETVGNAVWIMAALADLSAQKELDFLVAALGSELDSNRRRIFLLLSLIYEPRYMQLVSESFQSGSGDGKVYALELIDVFVARELKNLLFPMLEDLSLNMRLKRLGSFCPHQRLEPVDRIKDIANCEFTRVNRWTRVCALYALGRLPGRQVADELVAHLFNPDPVLRQTAAQSVHEMDRAALAAHATKLPPSVRRKLDRRFGAGAGEHRSDIEKVFLLQDVSLFAAVPAQALMELSAAIETVNCAAGTSVFVGGDGDKKIYAIIEGRVQLHLGESTVAVLAAGEVLGAIAHPHVDWQSVAATAEADALLLCMDRYGFYTAVADHIEAAMGLIRVDGCAAPVETLGESRATL